MECRRAGEALLRNHSQVLSFLAPSISRQPMRASTKALTRPTRRPLQAPQSRCLSTTRHLNQADSNDTPSDTKPTPAPRSSLTDLLDNSLDFAKGTATSSQQRTSRFKSPSAQAGNRSSGNATSDSFKALIDNFQSSTLPRRGGGSGSYGSGGSSGFGLGGMLDPMNNTNPSKYRRTLEPVLPFQGRLGPSLGRSVTVDDGKGIDVGRAFRQLEIACGKNKVRADFNRQRFHERPGLKRKRLYSERWRKKFKEGFRGMVKMVAKMKKKGW